MDIITDLLTGLSNPFPAQMTIIGNSAIDIKDSNGNPNAKVSAAMKDAERNRKYSDKGEVGVDCGSLLICDPSYLFNYANDYARGTAYQQAGIKTYDDMLPRVIGASHVTQLNYKMGHAGLGVLLGGFGGDGHFTVTSVVGGDGCTRSATIHFE